MEGDGALAGHQSPQRMIVVDLMRNETKFSGEKT